MSKRFFSTLSSAICVTTLAMCASFTVVACSTDPSVDYGMFDLENGDRVAFSGTGDPSLLTAEEHAMYRSDAKYVQNLAPSGQSVVLNHADDRQHRFVLSRMKLAGKTPANSPALFARLEEKRQEHRALGLQPGTFVSMDNAAAKGTAPGAAAMASGDLQTLHAIASVKLDSAQTQLDSIALASSPVPTYYAWVDNGQWDEAGNPIAQLVYREVYTNVPYESVRTSGNTALATTLTLESDSYFAQDRIDGGLIDRYVVNKQRRGPTLTQGSIDAPKDLNLDGCTKVCLSRRAADCDWNLVGSSQFRLPLKGSVSISGGYQFDQATINNYASGLVRSNESGRIYVVLANVGGGCDVSANNTLDTPMQEFWRRVTLSADKMTLSWDMTGTNTALFDTYCKQVQNQVELTMNIQFPWVHSNGIVGSSAVSMSNNAVNATPTFGCIKITNSCLAAGTLIDLGNGNSAPIESIKTGDAVLNLNDRSDNALTVSDVTIGVEETPMVRIADERGHNLLLTEMHPIAIEGRGMVMAKDVVLGDVVTTKEGPSKLVRVTREKYDGKVHNLKVGSSEEMSRLGRDQTTMYANGILVGDAQIQGQHEEAALAERTAKAQKPTKLPKRLQRDYRSSSQR